MIKIYVNTDTDRLVLDNLGEFECYKYFLAENLDGKVLVKLLSSSTSYFYYDYTKYVDKDSNQIGNTLQETIDNLNAIFSKNVLEKEFLAVETKKSIKGLNYNLLGLHKKEYFDTNGDLITLEYYKNYDEVSKVYTDLAIKEERQYTRNITSGLIEKRVTNIEWYNVDGEVNETKQNLVKIYSAKKGFTANKRARQNLLDNASMFLYAQLLTNNSGDAELTETQIEDFETLTNSEQSKYVNSNIIPLTTIISETTDINSSNYRDYITAAIRTTLLTILDIRYA